MSYCVGLTGGICSGKSTVAALFAQHGVPVIDSDAISHQLTRPDGAAIEAIRAAFGPEYIDARNALDRARMRELIFHDAAAKSRLEAILHPLIRARMMAEAATVRAPYALLVVPLLFEAANYRELAKRTLVVDCEESAQLARAMRRGLSERDARAVMASQMARRDRLKLADDIIRNDGKPETLSPQVEALHRSYLALSTGNN
jgi:dephospho-CoA kinase